jgi:hypothetical protein
VYRSRAIVPFAASATSDLLRSVLVLKFKSGVNIIHIHLKASKYLDVLVHQWCMVYGGSVWCMLYTTGVYCMTSVYKLIIASYRPIEI